MLKLHSTLLTDVGFFIYFCQTLSAMRHQRAPDISLWELNCCDANNIMLPDCNKGLWYLLACQSSSIGRQTLNTCVQTVCSDGVFRRQEGYSSTELPVSITFAMYSNACTGMINRCNMLWENEIGRSISSALPNTRRVFLQSSTPIVVRFARSPQRTNELTRANSHQLHWLWQLRAFTLLMRAPHVAAQCARALHHMSLQVSFCPNWRCCLASSCWLR